MERALADNASGGAPNALVAAIERFRRRFHGTRANDFRKVAGRFLCIDPRFRGRSFLEAGSILTERPSALRSGRAYHTAPIGCLEHGVAVFDLAAPSRFVCPACERELDLARSSVSENLDGGPPADLRTYVCLACNREFRLTTILRFPSPELRWRSAQAGIPRALEDA